MSQRNIGFLPVLVGGAVGGPHICIYTCSGSHFEPGSHLES